jgi:hypothetical protein
VGLRELTAVGDVPQTARCRTMAEAGGADAFQDAAALSRGAEPATSRAIGRRRGQRLAIASMWAFASSPCSAFLPISTGPALPRGFFMPECEEFHTRQPRNRSNSTLSRWASGAWSCSMSGDHRLNREQKPARSKTSLIIILLVLFAAAGIAITLMFSRFDASMPAQLMAP